MTLLSFLYGARSNLDAFFCAQFSFCPSTLFAFPTLVVTWLEMEKRSFWLFITKDKENDCIYHIFTSVDSFLGLSYWYLVYFGHCNISPPILMESLRELFSVFQLLIFPFVLFLKPHYYREFNRQSFYIYNPYLRITSKEKRPHSVSENTSFCLKILFGHKCSFYFLKTGDWILYIYTQIFLKLA